MHYEKIKVVSYSGHKGAERPRAFVLQAEEINIIEILDMRIEESLEEKARRRFFRAKGSDGYEYRIYYDEKADEWYLS